MKSGPPELGTALATAKLQMAPLPAMLAATIALSAIPAWAMAQHVQTEGDRAWRPSHIALAAGFATALWIDAAQTRDAMALGYREANPILGPHPSQGQVNTYTVIAGLTVLGVAAVASPRMRPWVLATALVVEAATVALTVRQGISITF